MSFLDRLKREGDQQKAALEQESREREERDAQYKNEIEPRMRALVVYLEGLVATLHEVKPQIVVTLPITGYGDLGAQPTWDFKLDHERRYRNFVVSLTWTLRVDPEHAPVIRADGVTKVKALTSVFRHNHLGGIKEELRTKSGEVQIATFHARGYIKSSFEAKISADDPVLRMVFSNASWLGSSQRQFAWQQINEDLFDRIARFIVRESDALFTEEVPAALRQKLGKEQPAATDRRSPDPLTPVDRVQASSAQEPVMARAAVSDPSAAVIDEASLEFGGDDFNESWSVAAEVRAEPEPPSLPSLEELNAALSVATFAPEITRTSMPNSRPATAVVASPAIASPTPAIPAPPAEPLAVRGSDANLMPVTRPVAATAPPEGDEAKRQAQKTFMSRMSSTLQRLREETDGNSGA